MKTTFFKFLLLLPFFAACQTVNLRVVCPLPTETKESSGLVIESPNRFWTHNDSGDKARLYQFDSTGILRRTVVVKKADNVDWEDIALDAERRNFYIGDFGNNGQNRTDLTIYKIPIPQSATTFFQTDTVIAEKIAFSYPDQLNFPPVDSSKYFDAEAFIFSQKTSMLRLIRAKRVFIACRHKRGRISPNSFMFTKQKVLGNTMAQ